MLMGIKANEFANKILSLPASKQNEFFEKLKNSLPRDDWETVVRFIALCGMFRNAMKYEAIKNSICDKLCEEMYGHTVGKANNREDDILVSMYSNSIL